MLDAILVHKTISIHDNRDKHVSWEFVDLKEVQEDGEQLIEGILYLCDGVRGEILSVVILYPGNAKVKQYLAGEWGVWGESQGLH